ncbi:MAG: hypothetical protein VB877_00190, partial [Pirellulaceae bacterium]
PDDAWRRALGGFKGKLTEADLLEAPFVQLFYLGSDPHEDTNLAASYPDRVSRMIALLKRQIETGRSTPGPRLKNDKNVRIISTNDRRIPDILRDRLKARK